jgi:hypothetical protein
MTDLAFDLFGPPPLMKGEDHDRYLRLLAAVKHQIQPKDFFGDLLVKELTDKMWEQQRCKSGVAALVEGAYIEALTSLLGPFLPRGICLEDPAVEMARNYYNGDASTTEMKKMEECLARFGITPEQIRAKAMQLCGAGVLMLNRMGTNCESALRILRKENERRAAANDNDGAADDREDGAED